MLKHWHRSSRSGLENRPRLAHGGSATPVEMVNEESSLNMFVYQELLVQRASENQYIA